MNLKTLNAVACGAHLAALGGVTLAFRNQPRRNRIVTTFRDAIDTDNPTPPNGCTSVDFPLKNVPAYELDPKEILQFYFGVSAAAHAFYALDPGGVYSAAVARGNNPFRWGEYALSAGSMMGLIAALDGNRDGNAVLMAAGSVAALNVLGNSTESLLAQGPRHDYFAERPRGLNPPAVPKNPLYTATVVAWLLLFLSFFTTISAFKKLLQDVDAIPDAPKPPSWLTYVSYTQLLYFCAFGAVQVMQLRDLWKQEAAMARGDAVSVRAFEDFERMYILLSLAAKLTLGGFVTFGLLQRTSTCPDPTA